LQHLPVYVVIEVVGQIGDAIVGTPQKPLKALGFVCI
jgi:hypothetical protein